MFDDELVERTKNLLQRAGEKHWRISCGESCTGGLIAGLLTHIPGSSHIIGRSFVTYSNRAKRELLFVPDLLLKTHGAVSEEVVSAMAQGVFNRTSAHLTIAVSGIAGPGGGTGDKPVGTVHMATATQDGIVHIRQNFGDIGRAEVRMATVCAAIDMLADRL